MRRKVLSVVLCVCMMMTMVPFAFAAEDSAFDLADKITKANSGDTITLPEGTFDLEGITVEQGKSLTFTGAGKDKTIVTYGKPASTGSDGGGGAYYGFDGAGAITFKNVTLQDKVATKNYYRGFVRATSMNFENCKFTNVAGYWGSGAVQFTNCEFTTDVADSFNMKCYSGTSFTFDGCTFKSPYGFIDAYRQNNLSGSVDVSINNCTFTGTASTAAPKPAVRLCDYTNPAEGGAWNIYFTGTNTVTNVAVDSKTDTDLYGCRFYDSNLPLLGTVTVNGEKVWENGAKVEKLDETNSVAKITTSDRTTYYKTLAEAVHDAAAGDTVTLLTDTNIGSSELTLNKSIIIDGGADKHSITGISTYVVNVTALSGNVTLSNVTVKALNSNDGRAIAILKPESNETTKTADGLKLMVKNCVVEATKRGITMQGAGVKNSELIVENSTISLLKAAGSAYDYDAEYNNNDCRGLALWNVDASTITVKNSTIQGFTYAINNGGTGSFTANIVNSTFKGRAAINDWTSGTTWNVTDSMIRGLNNQNGEHESFGCIVFNRNTTAEAKNNICNVNNCAFIVSYNGSGITNTNAKQFMFAVRGNNNTMYVDKDKVGTSYKILNTSKGGIRETGATYNDDVKETSKTYLYGGSYDVGPTAYVADGKATLTGTDGYRFMVGDKTTTVAVPATTTPETDVTNIPEAQKDAVKAAAASVKDNGELAAAANTAAKDVTTTAAEGQQLLQSASISATTDNTKIYVQTYLDIKADKVEVGTDNKITSITLDITPMSRVVASTATTAEDVALDATTSTPKNAVILPGSEKALTNIQTMVISFELPANFVSLPDGSTTYPNVYVQHKGHEYTATVTATTTGDTTTLIATFTNPDGFSPFTISTDSTAVATIGTNSYTTLQAAVDAVKDGETINVTGTDLSATVSGNKSFKVTGNPATLTAAPGYNLTNDSNGKYTVSRQHSGSSGSTTTSYNVNVTAATNGTVTADKKTAAKGATVTVTATPSAGYVVEAVKVVDKDGKDVAVTAKDGKYVFTMPGSAVTVSAAFKAETPAPSGLPFTDVKSGDWFYDAVKYAYENGLMTGTSATTFAPNGTMNRAMIVTVLYRLEKSPAVTAAAKFTDVPAGQWYSDAVAWAAANNIVNGYSETSFGPMNAVTREQMAAILFRYEQYKGLENVTLEENLNRFPDQDKISSYAVPAMQWAVGQKIINGNADGTLDPTGTATRAQVAQIFMNLLK